MRFWAVVLGRVGVVLGPLGVVLGASWDDLGRLGRIFGFWDVICLVFLIVAGSTVGPFVVEFALWRLPKSFREVPKMRFDGIARVSRAAAQLAFFVADALDVYEGRLFETCSSTRCFLTRFPFPC